MIADRRIAENATEETRRELGSDAVAEQRRRNLFALDLDRSQVSYHEQVRSSSMDREKPRIHLNVRHFLQVPVLNQVVGILIGARCHFSLSIFSLTPRLTTDKNQQESSS